MPIGRDGRSVTCDDCYFRQELLCALNVDKVCPTFRATVGKTRVPRQPRQAQLVPMATHGLVAQSVPPFGTASEEATFVVHDAGQPTPMLVRDAIEQPVRHADDQHRLAAAAAHRNAGIECVIETPDAESDTREPCLVVADHAANRMGRVARRVAERYPNALQLC